MGKGGYATVILYSNITNKKEKYVVKHFIGTTYEDYVSNKQELNMLKCVQHCDGSIRILGVIYDDPIA